MHPAVEALFQDTRARVTEQDIVDFSPGDPGYPDYVDLWTRILRSGIVPKKAEFDLTEVIGLTGWTKLEEEAEPERFRNYRRFTCAVALALVHLGMDFEGVRPINYLVCTLITDVDPDDGSYLALVRDALAATEDLVACGDPEIERPFLAFADMILSQMAGDFDASRKAASRLIATEAEARANEATGWYVQDDRFLLGLSVYDQVHGDWMRFAAGLTNPLQHEDTQLVIEAMAMNWTEDRCAIWLETVWPRRSDIPPPPAESPR